eukprot:3712707-Prymnesium_polylepis.2
MQTWAARTHGRGGITFCTYTGGRAADHRLPSQKPYLPHARQPRAAAAPAAAQGVVVAGVGDGQ